MKHKLQRNDGVEGAQISIQCLGAVGSGLARQLHEKGTKLYVADINRDAITRAVDTFGATMLDTHEIHAANADVSAPCAMGAVINDHELPARIVASSANNQLAKDRHGAELSSRGILYVPDYVINAGGMIKIAHGPDFDKNHDETRIYDHLDQIHDTLSEVFQRADSENTTTNFVADAMSEERFQTAL